MFPFLFAINQKMMYINCYINKAKITSTISFHVNSSLIISIGQTLCSHLLILI